MKKRNWLVLALVAAGASYKLAGGCLNQTQRAPDERFAAHLDDICEIARDHVESPSKGVDKLGNYMGRHYGDMMKEMGDTIALIEKISDDAKHDARARLARDRFRRPFMACASDLNRFGDAINANPEARAKMQRFNVRLNRTLEIIFGEGQNAQNVLGLDLELPGRGLGTEALRAAGALVTEP